MLLLMSMRHVQLFVALFFCFALKVYTQIPENVYSPKVRSVQLFPYGNQLAYPMIKLGSADQLELHFDDLDANVRNYSYTFQLCNADWSPAMLSHFDFIKGFSQVRITNYRISSVAYTRYTHYQALLPDRNCVPSRSGNYILKVFQDGDTSKLLFTKKMLVYEEKSLIAAQIQQPFNGLYFRTHQKVQFKVNLNERVDAVNAQQQIKVAILQNYRWDNAITTIKPTFFSRKTLEYNTENDAVFPAGKEWRWLDLRSFRLQSDRVADAKYTNKSTEIFVRPDVSRNGQKFNFYRDANGRYYIQPSENVNPFWQADYAAVHFSYVPQANQPYADKDVFIVGQLNNYDLSDASKMTYNAQKGVYESQLFLKQGYYDYMYVTIDKNDPKRRASFTETEGDLWETENEYLILVYYRQLGGRADELIGYAKVNSLVVR
jgi:hypothetical protein